jgi:hypothetical protein
MSFGYSVGDFVAITTLAWRVYKSCRQAPGSFGDIASEVASLHTVLKEAEETVFAQTLPPAKQDQLRVVGDGCRHVLEDLDNLVKKYQSLGTQSKRTWDRMRWGAEDISELRTRLISNTGLLTGLLTVLIRYVHEFQLGTHIRLTVQLVVYLKPVSRRSSMTFCKSLEKESDKAQLCPIKLSTHYPWTRKKSGVLFEKSWKILE